MATTGLRERKFAARRALIVDVGEELFVAYGYDSVTIEQIAARCDIAPRTIARYFPTKQQIALAKDRDRAEALASELQTCSDPLSGWDRFVAGEVALLEDARHRARHVMLSGSPTLDAARLAIGLEIEEVLHRALATTSVGRSSLESRLLAAILVSTLAAYVREDLNSGHRLERGDLHDAVGRAIDSIALRSAS